MMGELSYKMHLSWGNILQRNLKKYFFHPYLTLTLEDSLGPQINKRIITFSFRNNYEDISIPTDLSDNLVK